MRIMKILISGGASKCLSMIFASALLLSSVSSHATSSLFEGESLGIVGDSLPASALTNPAMFISYYQLLVNVPILSLMSQTAPKVKYFRDPNFFGIREPIGLATRVFPSVDEHRKGDRLNGFNDSLLSMFEIEEYSFGYMVGSYFGVRPKDMIFAAESGMKVEDLSRQFRRLLYSRDVLPERILVSYNGNDMCAREIIGEDPEEFGEKYYRRFVGELRKVITSNEFSPSPKSTSIYILGSLEILQLLTKPDLLLKLVNYRGGEGAFCGEIREQKVRGGELAVTNSSGTSRGRTKKYKIKARPDEPLSSNWHLSGRFSQIVDQKTLSELLPGTCWGVFQVKPSDKEGLAHLQRIFEALIKAQKRAVHEAQKWVEGTGFKVHYLEETTALQFDNSNISNDCFHPSISGHEKVAKKVIESIESIETLP
jgi:hypothetical protein